MRISKLLLTGLLAAACLGTPARAGGGVTYASPEAAFEQGLGAYRSGYYEIAVPALTVVAETGSEKDRFFARFYLARIYSDNTGLRTDHARAYELFDAIVKQSSDVEPEDGRRAPFVAKAMVALAGYLRHGLPQAGIAPDPERANDFLQDAASLYNDKDAQFELAKVQLASDATPEDIKLGIHYLSTLAEEGHAGAQAYLADLHWRGRFVDKDEARALALVNIAVEHAPPHERVWIEDIYQTIYCGASKSVRKQAQGRVASWRQNFPRTLQPQSEEVVPAARLGAELTCQGGEIVDLDLSREPASSQQLGPAIARPLSGSTAVQGNAAGFEIRGAGLKK